MSFAKVLPIPVFDFDVPWQAINIKTIDNGKVMVNPRRNRFIVALPYYELHSCCFSICSSFFIRGRGQEEFVFAPFH